MRRSWIVGACAMLALPSAGWAQQRAEAPRTYRVLATAESADQVALIEFTPCPATPCGARVTRTYDVGLWPAETEGPHGVVASADGRTMYVSLAHGRPFGYLQRIDMASGRPTGLVEVGMFAATVDIGPGGLVYVINFNFEDPDMRPSSVSVVDGASMTEVARPVTCAMPHGSRLNPQGTRHYSGCMMNDVLVEVDARTFAPLRMLGVAAGHEGPVPLPHAVDEDAPPPDPGDHMAAHQAHGGPLPMPNACSPTWAQPSADGRHVFVACNRSNEIVDVDVASWRVTRRWDTPPGPYNLAVSRDGRLLVATQKPAASTTVWNIADGRLLAEIPGTRRVASGVAVSTDSRYAFVTLEGVGGEPGTVDIIDLQSLTKVASVEIGRQAGGIWVIN